MRKIWRTKKMLEKYHYRIIKKFRLQNKIQLFMKIWIKVKKKIRFRQINLGLKIN